MDDPAKNLKAGRLRGPIALGVIILALDLLSKWAALRATMDGAIEVLPFFNLVLVWNQGVSFGLLAQGAPLHPYWLAALSGVIAIGFSIWMARASRILVIWAAASVIGGAIGNIIDRFRYGAVVDFLDFHLLGYHWPAFNIADCAIVVGIAIILFDGLWLEPRDERVKAKRLET